MGGGARQAAAGMMPAAPMRIRPARAEDVDAIHSIEVASFADPWRRDGFRDLVLGGNATVVVAESGETIVGFAVSYAAADEGPFPSKYMSTSSSELKYTIKAGANPGTDFKLEKK